LREKNSLSKLPDLINSKNIKNVLIVTDKGISSLGLMDGLLEGLTKEDIKYVIYDRTIPNPTIENIEEAFELYKSQKCEAIVAFGGGSPMDCAKGVGARISRPHKSIFANEGITESKEKASPFVCNSDNRRYWK
jgi:alcohol dehydrogenase class IV